MRFMNISKVSHILENTTTDAIRINMHECQKHNDEWEKQIEEYTEYNINHTES